MLDSKRTVKACDLLRNRSGKFFICGSCKSDIDKDRMPKRSHKQTFKFANFPQNLIRKLKQTCNTPVSSISKHFKERTDLAERKAVKLNKLESFLLKLV